MRTWKQPLLCFVEVQIAQDAAAPEALMRRSYTPTMDCVTGASKNTSVRVGEEDAQ
jgi:hypothetical protein